MNRNNSMQIRLFAVLMAVVLCASGALVVKAEHAIGDGPEDAADTQTEMAEEPEPDEPDELDEDVDAGQAPEPALPDEPDEKPEEEAPAAEVRQQPVPTTGFGLSDGLPKTAQVDNWDDFAQALEDPDITKIEITKILHPSQGTINELQIPAKTVTISFANSGQSAMSIDSDVSLSGAGREETKLVLESWAVFSLSGQAGLTLQDMEIAADRAVVSSDGNWQGGDVTLQNIKVTDQSMRVLYLYHRNAGSLAQVTVVDCYFSGTNDKKTDGELLWLGANVDAYIENSHFIGNNNGSGAAIRKGGGESLEIVNCLFEGNHTTNSGNAGAVNVTGGKVIISDSTFNDNTTDGLGGAIYLASSLSQDGYHLIEESYFNGNQSAKDGGAIYIEGSKLLRNELRLKNVYFFDNKAAVGIEGTLKGPYTVLMKLVDGGSASLGGHPFNNHDVFAEQSWMLASDEIQITFDSDGGSEVAPIILTIWETPTMPDDPTKPGHQFIQWLLDDGEPYGFDEPLGQSIALKAEWKPVQAVTYTVKFDLGDGAAWREKTVTENQPVAKPETDPQKEGYQFVQWLLNGEAYDFNKPVTDNITLVAQWQENKTEPPAKTTFTITFNLGNGVLYRQTVQEGDLLSRPADPEREGYQFVRWLLDSGDEYLFDTPVTAAFTLTAQWSLKDTGTDGGSNGDNNGDNGGNNAGDNTGSVNGNSSGGSSVRDVYPGDSIPAQADMATIEEEDVPLGQFPASVPENSNDSPGTGTVWLWFGRR